MTTSRQRPDVEMERAMLADYVARLEKQLGAVETRAKEAESDAKDARNALTEALLEKARDQKSTKDRNGVGPAPAKTELATLRAELEAARQDLMRHKSLMEGIREATARDLRVEYEQKFHAAEERMAQEFQKRFADAQNRIPTDKSGIAFPTSSGTHFSHTAKPGATAAIAKEGTAAVKRKPFLAIVAAAFAGGFALGWAALPSKEVEIVSESVAPVTAEPRPLETTAAKIELPPAPIAPQPRDDGPVMSSEARTAGAEPVEAPQQPDVSHIAEAYRDAQERNAALTQQLDVLQRRLDRATARAGAAEATLRSERERSSNRSRAARNGVGGQVNKAPDTEPVTTPLTPPVQVSTPVAQPSGAAALFPGVE